MASDESTIPKEHTDARCRRDCHVPCETAFSCGDAGAVGTLSGVRFRVVPLTPNAHGDWLDRKSFNGGQVNWRGGAPFYIPHNGGILKTPAGGSTVMKQ